MAKKSAPKKKSAKPAKKAAKKTAAKRAKKTAKKAAAKPTKKAAKKAVRKPAKKAAKKTAKKTAAKPAKSKPARPAAKPRRKGAAPAPAKAAKADRPKPAKAPKAAGKRRAPSIADVFAEIEAIRSELRAETGKWRKSRSEPSKRISQAAPPPAPPAQSESALRDRISKLERTMGAFASTTEKLKKELGLLERDSGLCNAGTIMTRIQEFDKRIASFAGEILSIRTDISDLASKANEIAAKFNMHSHFLKAKNWNQDLLFRIDPIPPLERDSRIENSPRSLGAMPARPPADPGEFSTDLRLTPPRHWDDPIIWFDNISSIEKEADPE